MRPRALFVPGAGWLPQLLGNRRLAATPSGTGNGSDAHPVKPILLIERHQHSDDDRLCVSRNGAILKILTWQCSGRPDDH